MNKLMILSSVALIGLAGSAIAQAPDQRPDRGRDITRAQVIQRSDAVFARLDTNHDGRFTREEAQAMSQQRRAQMQTRMFERLDANHDGQISREEFAQAHRGPGPRGPGGPGMHGPGGPGGPGPMADRSPGGPPPPGGPGMGRFRHGPGAGMRMGARLFGDAGFVTAEQFRARALERFDRADTNHDGTLTAAERQAQRGQMRHRRMGPPPGGPDMPPPPPQPAR